MVPIITLVLAGINHPVPASASSEQHWGWACYSKACPWLLHVHVDSMECSSPMLEEKVFAGNWIQANCCMRSCSCCSHILAFPFSLTSSWRIISVSLAFKHARLCIQTFNLKWGILLLAVAWSSFQNPPVTLIILTLSLFFLFFFFSPLFIDKRKY